MPTEQQPYRVAIIGAGPAGLTAAYLLSRQDIPAIVFEADPAYVGGISKTIQYHGFYFDIGGHRFFSKSREVEDFWTEILGADLLVRPRSSKIFYRGHFFHYPLKPLDAFLKLGILESARCLASYVRARLFPVREPASLEDWVSNQFGSRLYRIFFKTYTEKVWGIPCNQISADWAAQRIKGLSLMSAVWSALAPRRISKDRTKVIKTLLDQFRYPRRGPGMLWEACAAKAQARGCPVLTGHKVTGCRYDRGAQLWTIAYQMPDGSSGVVQSRHLISSAPMKDLIQMLAPVPPAPVLSAAAALKYRDFITVALIMRDRNLFDDNWIYIHDPKVKMGRIQNFKSWSPEMVPDSRHTCYGLEYFCFEGDALWTSPDAELIELGKREIETIGLAAAGDVVDGYVVRQAKAYPVYDGIYTDHVRCIRAELAAHYPNLHLIGRNGMHKYNNQDHSMMTAMLCVKNIIAGQPLYDLWRVNQDAEYHETEIRKTGA